MIYVHSEVKYRSLHNFVLKFIYRSQQEIINTMNINRVHLFQEAWVGGETYLLEGRSEDRLPSADECTFKRDLSPEVRQEWATYIGGFSKLE